ncbi:hypothetical protein A3K86_08200 [Photobacterium jeanii]|uniref:Uncharacterized protein n=1 Tax=Photobacterium jeanii TaxID=858640 RepID=A0A178KK16_9GAMM|nr:hypothetical protein [Photobacterium jeanii]OAN16912.1 hypothetical protein A3K86_08200 [Photobacterium jeanii]PST88202.1 hypothetical protein C9I91_16505 [Photobacterium jeanii]
MQFNYSTLAASLALALTLTGCNDSDSNNNTVSGNTIKVIDGYLSQAEVCIDRNNNQSCDTGEALSTLTNAKGEITIPEADAKHPIIARAIAGKTTDSDKAGALGNSYELIAEAGSKVVTPFTTMAKVQQKTLDELATDLNLPSDVISGDYVAMKASEEKAKEAHLLARSVTTELAPSVKDNQAAALATTTQTIQTEINNQVNAGANLDDITIEVDDSGKASSATIIRSLDAYLKDGDSQFTSMNQYYALKEGIFKVKVSGDGELTVTNKSGATDTTQYSTDGNALVLTDGKNTERDTFIYITEDLSLSVTDQSDLTLWTKGSLTTSKTLTKAHFDGKTWYYLSDDAPKDSSKAQPMVAKMVFGQDKVTITEPYGKSPTDAMELPWEIKNDKLIVDFPEGEADFNVTLYLEDTNMMAVYNYSTTRMGVYDLLIKDKTMADTLYTTWKSVK